MSVCRWVEIWLIMCLMWFCSSWHPQWNYNCNLCATNWWVWICYFSDMPHCRVTQTLSSLDGFT